MRLLQLSILIESCGIKTQLSLEIYQTPPLSTVSRDPALLSRNHVIWSDWMWLEVRSLKANVVYAGLWKLILSQCRSNTQSFCVKSGQKFVLAITCATHVTHTMIWEPWKKKKKSGTLSADNFSPEPKTRHSACQHGGFEIHWRCLCRPVRDSHFSGLTRQAGNRVHVPWFGIPPRMASHPQYWFFIDHELNLGLSMELMFRYVCRHRNERH